MNYVFTLDSVFLQVGSPETQSLKNQCVFPYHAKPVRKHWVLKLRFYDQPLTFHIRKGRNVSCFSDFIRLKSKQNGSKAAERVAEGQ